MSKLKTQSLHKRESALANSKRQLEILSNGIFKSGELPTFKAKIAEIGHAPLKPNTSGLLSPGRWYKKNQDRIKLKPAGKH